MKFVPFICLLVLLAGCTTPAEHERIAAEAVMPMYGQPEIQRSEALKKADADFVAKATAVVNGDRKLASVMWAKQGENFLRSHDRIRAMLRYNQAWLLDENNYLAYWGFGQVMGTIDKFDDSIKYLRRAIELCTDNYQIVGIYSDLGVMLAQKASALPENAASERQSLFAEADDAIQKSIQLNPSYGNNWRAWCISLVLQGKYEEASEKLKKARELGANELPKPIAQKLSAGLASK